jgi:Mrp family chromosome partitioning ATPase
MTVAVIPAGVAVRHYQAFVDALERRPAGGGIISVVSPQRGDGRSTVAAGLALTLAHEGGGRVLLLDLDLERPAQAARFGVAPDPSVRDCLDAPRDLDAVTTLLAPRLWLVPAGSGDPVASLGLLSAVGESGFLDDCRAAFTWTVVDLPPILDAPGVAPVAARSDECLLVGRYRTTRVEAMARAAALLPTPPLGCVMTAHSSPVPEWISRLVPGGAIAPARPGLPQSWLARIR